MSVGSRSKQSSQNQNTLLIKGEMDKLDFLKIKNFYSEKDLAKMKTGYRLVESICKSRIQKKTSIQNT